MERLQMVDSWNIGYPIFPARITSESLMPILDNYSYIWIVNFQQ